MTESAFHMITPTLAVGFLAPWLFAAGAAATSIPIIIHLLSRRRFKQVIWAAMDFLLAAQRRNARRLQFQKWLLLCLRCLALLVIAAAIAQFFLQNAAMGMFGGGERLTVVIWDDSYSMAYGNPGQPSNFDKSKKLLADWVKSLGSGDQVAILRASKGGTPVVPKPTLDRRQVQLAIADVAVSDAGTDLPGTLARALDVLEEERRATVRQVLILTDLSRSSLGGRGDEGSQQLKQAVEKLKDKASIRVADCGDNEQANKGIVDIRLTRPVIVAGHPAELEVVVRNGTTVPQSDIPLTVLVDGVPREPRKFGKIDPGGEGRVRVNVAVDTPGRHIIEARISNDLVPVDDVRRLVLNVVQEVPLLLVDGSPADDNRLGASTFLQVALAPVIDGKNQSIFAPHTVSEVELPRIRQLDKYAAVALCNIGAMDATTAARLRDYVDAGGLLMVFPGERTTSQTLNASLGEEGVRLLAANLGQKIKTESVQDLAAGIHFDPVGYTHPVLELFRNAQEGGAQVGLTSAQTQQYFLLNVPRDGSVETILRYSDGNAAVVARRHGNGKVVQFASSADTTWTGFPAKPSFVPFVWELMLYSLSPDMGGLTLPIGARVKLPVDAAPAGDWRGPKSAVVKVMTQVDKDNRAFLQSTEPFRHAGAYGPAGMPPVVAVNVDRDEADIRRITPAQMASAMGVDINAILGNAKTLNVQAETAGAGPGGALARNLLLLALALFALEALFARLFSVYR